MLTRECNQMLKDIRQYSMMTYDNNEDYVIHIIYGYPGSFTRIEDPNRICYGVTITIEDVIVDGYSASEYSLNALYKSLGESYITPPTGEVVGDLIRITRNLSITFNLQSNGQ